MKTKILNVSFDTLTREQSLNKVIQFLDNNSISVIFTPNPEMVMEAKKDKEFLKILNSGDLVIPDGIGIVMASKLNKVKIKERVAGCDLVNQILDCIKNTNYTVYLLGGAEGVCEIAKKNIEDKYNINIVGTHHGYFKDNEDEKIINDINSVKPDILLVALGFPRQEKWIYKYKDNLNVKVSMGVGGTVDVLAGKVNRAPIFYQKIGMEWFYRLMKQPSRITRVMQIPIFTLTVICHKITKTTKE